MEAKVAMADRQRNQ